MAIFTPPTTKNSPAIQKPAKKFNGSASEYAPPHTMSDKPVKIQNVIGTGEPDSPMEKNEVNPKTQGLPANGIVVRGTASQTKGRMARGPMA